MVAQCFRERREKRLPQQTQRLSRSLIRFSTSAGMPNPLDIAKTVSLLGRAGRYQPHAARNGRIAVWRPVRSKVAVIGLSLYGVTCTT